MKSLSSLLGFALLTLSTVAAAVVKRQNEPHPPTAHTRNRTYVGTYNPTYGTDYFLGMPFSLPPTGDLRYRPPQSLDSSWEGSRNASEYSPECYGYGLDTRSQGNYVSEDCLTLNVVRSRGSGNGLPVVIWIHGGGSVMGGSADNRYNQSFIVQQSAEAGMPIIAVSINYRLSAWGFLYGQAIQDTGNANLGYRDQRLAMYWVQENIAAFGGDPNRVTIQGESAGGTSVGAHLLAYGGRDDGIFSGAIAQSGPPVRLRPYQTLQDWEPVIANISRETGCANHESAAFLDCLRGLSADELNAVINSTATDGASYSIAIDGDFITEDAATQMQNGNFVHVPFIIGSNTDEGYGSIPSQTNTTEQFQDYLRSSDLDEATVQDMTILYPDIPYIGIPETLRGRPTAPDGTQVKRTAAVAGDIGQAAPRRLAAELWAQGGAACYTYRFNVNVNGQSAAFHFQEVAFTFYNTEGLGYPQNGNPNPLGGPNWETYLEIAQLMVRMWISFVNYGDPNIHLGVEANHWPVYEINQFEPPQNFVFEQNVTSHAEADLYRAEGIHYINEFTLARAGRNCSGIINCGGSFEDYR